MRRFLAAAAAAVTLLSGPAFPERPYVTMNADLAELKRDFNAATDQVRLVFIVGPT